MKKLVLFLLLLPFSIYPQISEWNLRNITALNVQLRDPQKLLTENNYLKVDTETKLKIKSAGIKLNDESPAFIIGITNVSENKYLIWLRIEEMIKVERNDKLQSAYGITYSNNEFIKSDLFESYNTAIMKTIDKMLNLFLSEFLEKNK